MFRHTTGIKINHVPYRGGGLALTDVMSGQVKFFFSNGSSVVGLIQGGKVKAIAHTGKGRLKGLPDIPPASDTLPGFEAYEWNGVFAPHGTPPDIVRKLNAVINEAISSADVKERFEQLNIETRANTPEEFRAFVADQMERWGKVVKDANIKLG
jgi:tripartite-type tricarboxylate transporter receptor subunit TctC